MTNDTSAEHENDVPDYMELKVMYALDTQWVKIDDMIRWCKMNKSGGESMDIHEMLKSLVKLKNQKPIE